MKTFHFSSCSVRLLMKLELCYVFLAFTFILRSDQRNNIWNPCSPARSSFEGILVDADGGKHPSCICNDGFFGEKCQLKVYISAAKEKQSENLFQETSRQPDNKIYPLKQLHVHRYPNGSTVVLWQHAVVDVIKYYALHFRPVLLTDSGWFISSPWRALVNIKPEYFSGSSITTPYSYVIDGFLNNTGYEINLAIVDNKTVLVSVSIFADAVDTQPWKEEKLQQVLYSASITWSVWTSWGQCETVSGCGKGIQRRSRVLEKQRCVSNKTEQTRPCKLKQCPVNGGWSGWVSWSHCSVSCGNGTRSRTRSCRNPLPRHGGKTCFGIRTMKTSCMKHKCTKGPRRRRWSTLEKFKNLNFTSMAIGAAAGFLVCLFIIICPRLLKRLKRTYKWKYKLINNEPCPPAPPPLPPPPLLRSLPTKNWKPTLPNYGGAGPCNKKQFMPVNYVDKQKEIANTIFLNDLMKAFKNFNVLQTNEKTKHPEEASRTQQ